MYLEIMNWNPLQAKLKELITKKDRFNEMKELLLGMHSLLHTSEIYQRVSPSMMDEIWVDLNEKAFRTMPTVKDDTIAWNIWHITRIEDLTANLLIQKGKQILDADWLKKLNTGVTDTGNAMNDEEIIQFSNEINREGLYQYRNEVGRRTKAMIEQLKPEDLKRKADQEGLDRIISEGGVTQDPGSIWLVDFWGRKNVAGIILMPITRHQCVHINDSLRLKKVCNRKK